jgi:hypothetical protein
LLQDVLYSSSDIFDRKNVIHGKAEIASVVVKRDLNGVGGALRLYFPFADPYVIREFASYLNYRGVAVEEVKGKWPWPLANWKRKEPVDEATPTAERHSIILATPHVAEDGLCHGTGPFTCHLANRPATGDLVIVLPDDWALLAEASVYRRQGEPLLSYEPFPSLPHWMYTLIPNLGQWMNSSGSVTLWK